MMLQVKKTVHSTQ